MHAKPPNEPADLANGTKRLPQVVIRFDPDQQSVTVESDPRDFKTLNIVLGILEMAKFDVEFRLRMTVAQNMQRQALAAAQEEHIRRQLGAR